MSNVEDRLHRLGDQPVPTVSDDVVRGDLRRSRSELTRRRVRMGAAGLSIAAVAAIGTTAVVADDTEPTPVAPAPHIAAPPDQERNEIELVAYEGEQKQGFLIEKVPEGFVLQGVTPFNLNVTRPGDDSHIDDFRNKIVVMLESRSVTGAPHGDPVEVGDLDGWLRDSGGATTLTYIDGEHRVVVQAWDSLGLTSDQVIEFAEGVTVTDEAQAGIG